jgi:Flp pilus assembly pilin Flp
MNTSIRRRGDVSARLAAQATSRAVMLHRIATRRGVTMIEYILLAAIAVVLAVLLRGQLSAMFSGILDDLRSALG